MKDLLRDAFFIKMVTEQDSDSEHFWRQWLKTHPDRKEDFELAQQIVRSLEYKKNKELSTNEYDKILRELQTFKQANDAHKLNVRQRFMPRYVRVASVILFIAAITYSIFWGISNHLTTTQTPRELLVEKSIPRGVKNTIKLKDGTIVRLNAESKLIFPEEFQGNTREVELIGEAFFDVAHDAAKPFIIKTGDVKTYVLGTSFNVRNYEHEDDIKIALVSGSLKVKDTEGNEAMLEPTEMAVYSRNEKFIQKQNFDSLLITGWKDNLLVFKKATMQQIIKTLEQWYGVNIKTELKKPITGLYSGEFTNEPLDVVLEGIGYASGFRFSIEEKNVIIKN